MVKIRLTRMGDKKSPVYRVVVADSRVARDGKYIDQVGFYNPLTDPAEIRLDNDKIRDWLSKGAQPTDTARDLFINAGILPKPEKRVAKTGKRPKKKD